MTVKRALPLILAVLTGLLSGMYIRLGFEIVQSRPKSPGGKIFLLPLIGLVFCLGYNIGKAVKGVKGTKRAFDQGFWEGYRRGAVKRRRSLGGMDVADKNMSRYLGL